VVLACLPLLFLSSMMHMRTIHGLGQTMKEAYERAAQVAVETLMNIRTVASMTREPLFMKMFDDRNHSNFAAAVRGALFSSLGYASSQCLPLFVNSLAFWYGMRLVSSGEITATEMMQTMFALIFSAVAIGNALSFAGDISKARISAISVLKTLDRKSKIDPTNPTGQAPKVVQGQVDLQSVAFRYPQRRKLKLFRNITFDVQPGQTIALVGPSGSGKSTVLGLIQRWYEADHGSVNVEGIPVKDWLLYQLRDTLSLVSQEPTLFNMSIGENIAYGKPGATQEEIESAAKQAHIHHYIQMLPKGYNTGVGERAVQLSGGQKQRIAIARALVRNPKILLLDEATSALDAKSEKRVQRALDSAAQGRTTLVVAHRLATIQNADLILVLQQGHVVERGNHQQLLEKGGLYAKLVEKQSLEVTH